MTTRVEKDSMGEMKVPAECLYGAQTARAVENFPISGFRFPRPFIKALGNIKRSAAVVNAGLGKLDQSLSDIIVKAADEVVAGKLDSEFVLDIFQTGSGTSSNMNANEVIANRALQMLGEPLGGKKVHPNDHVNNGQSSNDVIPTALHVSTADVVVHTLIPALTHLAKTLNAKAVEFKDIIKIGRTHLMDATPVTLGQEVSGWARQVELAIDRLNATLPRLGELAIGGTAVGTGLNTHPKFASMVCAELTKIYKIEFVEAKNHFEAQSAQDAIVEVSGQLKTIAASLIKIANDVRLLNSGPRCGFGEITVPAVQPGSSIMPGKVNPVMAEALAQVCAQVIGNDAAITVGGASGLLDLNVMLPMMAHNVLQSATLMATATTVFADRCIKGMTANKERAESLIEWSMSMVTALATHIGYDQAAVLAKEAVKQNKTVRELCIEKNVLPKADLDRLLDPWSMLNPS